MAAIRPVQEMAIADAALRASREVNADAIENSNIPEIYRAAADALFKAKKEYRLKNFDRARKYALRATLLAEKAEFEAVKSGGATPEATAARAYSSMEGAPPDPNYAADGSIDTGPMEPPPPAPPPGLPLSADRAVPPLDGPPPIDDPQKAKADQSEGELYTERVEDKEKKKDDSKSDESTKPKKDE